MRWDDLFNDLEGQLERELTAEEADLRAEEERLRLARLGIRDRLMSVHAAAAAGTGDSTVRLQLRDSSLVTVTPSTFGRDWFTGDLIHSGAHTSPCVVPLSGIASVIFSREQVYRSLAVVDAAAERSLSARLGLGFVLRDLCRRRIAVELRLTTGIIYGTLDRVGRDHCDLAVHDAGGIRRESVVTEFRLVPFTEVLLVRL
jgi:hypothetical protein